MNIRMMMTTMMIMMKTKKPEEIEIDYGKLSREELVIMLEEIVKEGEINQIKRKVSLIKVAFLKINKEEQHKKYEDFIAHGGEEKDFDSTQDIIDNRFNEAFSIYKNKRKDFPGRA